jgi:hypothetical protein
MPSLGAKKDVGKQKSAGKPRSPVRMPTIGDDVGNKRNFSSSDPRQAQTSYGTNAAVFDVAGIMLRMSVKQVKGAAKARGFVLTQEKKQIPNFVKWKYEAKCRAKGVVGFEALAACVLRRAVKQNKQYVSKLVFNKYETKETLEVYFTSTFTGNRVHKVDYRCMDDLSRGNTQKDRYLRMIWIQNFWRRIASKYGPPDDENRVRWGLGENKPFLMAATGRLLLVDPHLPEIDYSKMSRADRNTVNTDLFNF